MIGVTWEALDAACPSHCNDELMNARAVKAQLIERIGTLPTVSQIVVNLYFCCDMGLDQIAERLDVPTSELQEVWAVTLRHLCSTSVKCQEENHG